MHEIARLGAALLVFAIVLGAIERLAPVERAPRRSLRALARDLGWWLTGAVISRPLSRVVAIAVLVALAVPLLALSGAPVDRAHLDALVRAPTWLSTLPAPVQVLLALFAGDLAGYWFHRLSHQHGWLWRLHVVHHAPSRLDWIAAARAHPLNDVLGTLARVVPLFVLGVRPGVVAGLAPLLGAYAVFLHCDVRWDFGPLRYVVASPAFHRWHHAAEPPRPAGVNFAGLFPILDVLFGTFHCPRGVPAPRVGVDGPAPEGWLASLAHPFARQR